MNIVHYCMDCFFLKPAESYSSAFYICTHNRMIARGIENIETIPDMCPLLEQDFTIKLNPDIRASKKQDIINKYNTEKTQ